LQKQEIQNFIAWYVPAVLVTYFISGALFFSENGSVSFGYRLDFLASHLGAIICSGWLFINGSKQGLNKWLWGIFGLGAHLFAIVLYFGYMAFNKPSKPTL
jgi:hypothetical protein